MGKAKLKKHVKLYNAVWEALHADDKFVVTSKLCHAELAAYLAAALKEGAAQGGYSLIYFANTAQSGVDAWAVLADAAIKALQLTENQDEFQRAHGTELPEFTDGVCECTPAVPRPRAFATTGPTIPNNALGTECQSAFDDPPIHSTEDDYQHFLSYSNLKDSDDLRQAYYAGANVTPRRLIRLLRLAYPVGRADAQTPEL